MSSASLKLLDPARLTVRRIQLPSNGHEFVIGGVGADLDLGKPALLAGSPAVATRDRSSAPPGSGVRLLLRDGLCLLLEASADVEINRGVPMLGTSLHHGDVLRVGGLELVFGYFDEQREPHLEAAIVATPDSDEPWLVYADWLQEHGDLLGERIAQPHNPASDLYWLEGLDLVEVKWRHGMLEQAVFREGLGGWLGPLRSQITRLLSLRSASFLRELVIDLRAEQNTPLDQSTIDRVTSFLALLPPMPMLERLFVGYHLSDSALPPPIVVKDERFPRLRPGPVFSWAHRGIFEVVEAPGLRGAVRGDRVVAAGTRIGVEGSVVTLARLGEPGGENAGAFDQVGGRVLLRIAEGQEDRLEVNGVAWGQALFLLPGDLIDVFPEPRGEPVRLRFVLDATV